MAVRTREELMSALQPFTEGRTDEQTTTFLEDFADTLTDLEGRANPDGVDWKAKYEENDKQWRENYNARFFSPPPKEDTPPTLEPPKKRTFADLFTTES